MRFERRHRYHLLAIGLYSVAPLLLTLIVPKSGQGYDLLAYNFLITVAVVVHLFVLLVLAIVDVVHRRYEAATMHAVLIFILVVTYLGSCVGTVFLMRAS